MMRTQWVILSGWALLLGSFLPMAEVNRSFSEPGQEIRLIQLDPRHSHATAIQAEPSNRMSDEVYVYSPGCPELDQHLARIRSFNARKENPTRWKEVVYTGSDYLQRMLQEKKGNLVVLSGNNRIKIDYIEACIRAGLHVFADKPMVIDRAGFERLKGIFAEAAKRRLLLWDMMSERYSYFNILQAELMRDKNVFGQLQSGTVENPAVQETNVHVYGNNRPAWFYDVEQQGEAIPDVGTHLIDLTFWKCFPEVALDYHKDIQVISARHWPVSMDRSAFLEAISLKELPGYLRKCLTGSMLHITTNGSADYRFKGIHARVTSLWYFKAADNRAGDDRSFLYRGTKATLTYRHRRLWVQRAEGIAEEAFQSDLRQAVDRLQAICQGVSLAEDAVPGRMEIRIPIERRNPMNETKKFLEFLTQGEMPAWETSNLLAKYYITTSALEMAKAADK